MILWNILDPVHSLIMFLSMSYFFLTRERKKADSSIRNKVLFLQENKNSVLFKPFFGHRALFLAKYLTRTRISRNIRNIEQVSSISPLNKLKFPKSKQILATTKNMEETEI